MSQGRGEADREWGLLADKDEGERKRLMEERYLELARLSEEERRTRQLAMVRAEYALPDEKLRSFAESKLRVWLQMEPEAARKVAASYDAVMERMPADAAMRRVSTVQSLAVTFQLEEQERLRALLPRVFADRPTAVGMATVIPAKKPDPPARGRPWWQLWKR